MRKEHEEKTSSNIKTILVLVITTLIIVFIKYHLSKEVANILGSTDEQEDDIVDTVMYTT